MEGEGEARDRERSNLAWPLSRSSLPAVEKHPHEAR
jgi:hypothetical protein